MPASVIDSNVVLPLILAQHPHRKTAAAWWEHCDDESVHFTLPARMSVLRLLTNRTLMRDGILTPEKAWDALSMLTSDARAVVGDQEPPGLNLIWLRLVRGREPTPNLWTDAWLAAYAETVGAEMVTFDKGFRSFAIPRLRVLTG
ncbi:MAG TPA: PIN domain-containing protein [Kiritimatiellia bacterium]|nr:PIN domain-containing protein [Kiritimatiellia bacterium]